MQEAANFGSYVPNDVHSATRSWLLCCMSVRATVVLTKPMSSCYAHVFIDMSVDASRKVQSHVRSAEMRRIRYSVSQT